MKTPEILALMALSFGIFLPSCSDDNNESPEPEAVKVYSGKSLELEFSGEDMDGKSVKFMPDGNTATLTLYSTLNLAAVPGAGIINSVQGPGVIPGEPEAMIVVDLVRKGDGYTFSGSHEGTYCSYSYSGHVNDSKMELDIDNVQLKDKTLAGTKWGPQPLISNSQGVLVSSPLSLTWTSTADIDLGDGLVVSAQQIADMLVTTPLFTDKATGENTSLAGLITKYVESISFGADGSVMAQYKTLEGGNRLENEETPDNTLQYVLPSSDEMLLFVDVRTLVSDILDDTRAQVSTSTLLSTLESVLNVVQPQLAHGFPFNYSVDGDKMTLSLPAEITTPMVKQALTTLLGDQNVAEALLDKLAKDPQLQPLMPIIRGVMQQLPKVLEASSQISLTLNLNKTL